MASAFNLRSAPPLLNGVANDFGGLIVMTFCYAPALKSVRKINRGLFWPTRVGSCAISITVGVVI